MPKWSYAEPQTEEPKVNKKPKWSYAPEEPKEKESYGKSLLYSPFRVGSDLVTGAYEGIKKIPDMYQSAKTEIPGAMNLTKKPGGNLQLLTQMLAGANERSNIPGGVLNYLSDRLHLIPEEWSQKANEPSNFMSKILPEPLNQLSNLSLSDMIPEPSEPGEKFARGTGGLIPDLITGGFIKSRSPHLTRRGASDKLRNVQELVRERNLSPMNINPALIEDAAQFLPNTQPFRNALEAAMYGDYNSLFSLQSDLGRHSAGMSRDLFNFANRAHGREGLRAQQRLLQAIEEGLSTQGSEDLAELLGQGRRDYRRYSQFKPYRNAIGLGLASGIAAQTGGPKSMVNALKAILKD